jgi:hypothetical protein
MTDPKEISYDVLGLLDGQPISRVKLMQRTIMCAEIFTETLDLLGVPSGSFQNQLSDFSPDELPLTTVIADKIYYTYLRELSREGVTLIDDEDQGLH